MCYYNVTLLLTKKYPQCIISHAVNSLQKNILVCIVMRTMPYLCSICVRICIECLLKAPKGCYYVSFFSWCTFYYAPVFLMQAALPTSDLPKWSITAIKEMRGLKTRQIFSKKPKICSMVKQLSDLLTKHLRNKK